MVTKQIAWTTGDGNITMTYQGYGNGNITVSSDPNALDTARSQTITIETTAGSPVVVKNLTVSQGACPFPVGDIRNFAYTGNVQSVILPAGQYKLQCWGAQGGSNAANSSYGITAKAGGKGGYSEGVLTLTSPTTVYIFVGGKGSSSGNGGWNGGGGGSGSSSYNSGNEYGRSSFGCGGGATDIALVTSSMNYSSYRNNRSSASLLSRMIVAGGGSGGAYGYQEVTTSTSDSYTVNGSSLTATSLAIRLNHSGYDDNLNWGGAIIDVSGYRGWSYTVTQGTEFTPLFFDKTSSYPTSSGTRSVEGSDTSGTVPSDAYWLWVGMNAGASAYGARTPQKIVFSHTTSSTTTTRDYQVGGVGGGTQGGAYSSTYAGKQNAAGSGGSFGQGAAQSVTNYRYCSGAGGGGWYGGGNSYSDSGISTIRCSGGGSGFVNTSASAGNRPSGYTGLQLDSGTTYAGNTSFPSTSGGTETGHSGNGYAKITRIS